MNFHCIRCRNHFQAQNFNLLRVVIECPICATQNNISQSLGRVYGKVVGESIQKIVDSLVKVADRSKESLHIVVNAAYVRIEQICERGAE